MAVGAPDPSEGLTGRAPSPAPAPSAGGAGARASLLDRLVLAGAGLGLGLSAVLHAGMLAAGARPPVAPWSWLIHGGCIGGFWWAAARIRAAGLRGVAGWLRVRRMVPLPFRLVLGAATLNAMGTAGLAAAGRGIPGRAQTAYWLMMYLLVSILVGRVVRRLGAPSAAQAGPGATAG